jgi:branched-chain amino acid transport system permease protein
VSQRVMSLARTGVPWAVFVLVAFAGTLFGSFTLSVASVTMIWIILAAGLNISMGFGGVVNFGIGAFYGIGAYAAAVLAVNYHVNFILVLVAGPVFAAAAAALIGPVLLARTQHMQFAILTLAIGVIADDIFNNVTFLGGPNGIAGVVFPSFLMNAKSSYFFIALFAAATIALCQYIGRNHFGAVLRGVRDDPYLARSLGYRPLRYKSAAFVVSAAIAGLAGVMYAYYISYVSPTPFDLSGASFEAFAIVAFGGMGTIWGPVVAAFLLTAADEYVNVAPNDTLLFYGAAILIVVVIVPDGIGPGAARLTRRLLRSFRSRSQQPQPGAQVLTAGADKALADAPDGESLATPREIGGGQP